MAADGDLEVAHARERLTVQGHFVERQRLPAALITPHHAHHEVAAFLDRPLLGEHHIEGAIQIIEIGLGQKSQVAGVDRENRNPHRGGLPRGGKHRAVTPSTMANTID